MAKDKRQVGLTIAGESKTVEIMKTDGRWKT